MVEICACSTVAVPVVVIEGKGFLATGVVVQDDAWARGGRIALVCLYELRLGLFEVRDGVCYMSNCQRYLDWNC